MTRVQTIVFAAATWVPRSGPARAVMPVIVTCERRPYALAVDLCWELDRKLSWAISSALADMELLIARRNDLLDVLGPLTGVLRGATPPVPEPHIFKGRPWGTAREHSGE